MKSKADKHFWPSYSDLMTSLFFVMLVLFVLSFSLFNKNETDLENKADSLRIALKPYNKIKEIEKSLANLDTIYFDYKPNLKKHILKIEVQFDIGSSKISDVSFEKRLDLKKAGNRIINLIKSHKVEENIKYLVIIEGQASKDGWRGNDVLSYSRALSLLGYWKDNNIKLDEIDNCELIIAGSGEKGIPRIQPDIPPNNQRFLIYVIPKVGEIE